MSDKPTCCWFRFRLLTAVLMMLAAGGLLGANALLHPCWPVNGNNNQQRCMLGFPCAAFSYIPDDLMENDDGGGGGAVTGYFEYQPHFRTSGVAFNGVVVLVAVVGIAFISESILRRRAVVNTAQTQYRETKPCS